MKKHCLTMFSLEHFIAGNPRCNQRWPQKYKKGPTPLSFGCHETSDPRPQKLRPRNLSLLEISKERRFKLVSILSPKMFYGHAWWKQPERIKIFLVSGLWRMSDNSPPGQFAPDNLPPDLQTQ